MSNMTRRDYVMIAAALRDSKPYKCELTPDGEYANPLCTQWAKTARQIAYELAEDNPRFDKQRFLDAAGVED